MIDNKNLLKLLRIELRKMSNGNKLKFLTYKKDRSVLVEKNGDNFRIVEDGYRKIVWDDLTEAEVLKRVKRLQKIEFPRSNKLYLARKIEKDRLYKTCLFYSLFNFNISVLARSC